MKLSAIEEGGKSNKHVWYPPPLCFFLNCHLERAGLNLYPVQGDPDLETIQSPHFYFRESKLSDLALSLAICLYVYITICTPPPISPLYHTVLKTGGEVNIKTNEYSPLKKG
jgi:hypothetical protein